MGLASFLGDRSSDITRMVKTATIECAKECNCQGNQLRTCRKSDGFCICSPGYGGENCSKPCAMWRYGSECLGRCQCHVNNSISCDTITGVCMCQSGYISEFCEGAKVVFTENFFIDFRLLQPLTGSRDHVPLSAND
uniref:Cell death abnormality protein 1 n=1 Tax=Magallana gigas TaxID=29159 RepID=K1R241_MAGGI